RLRQPRHQHQVAADRTGFGQAVQARGAVGEHAGALGHAQARDAGVVEGFDFASWQDALHVPSIGSSGNEAARPGARRRPARGRLGQSPEGRYFPRSWWPSRSTSSRSQARWCFQAQPRVTEPRSMASIAPLTQNAAYTWTMIMQISSVAKKACSSEAQRIAVIGKNAANHGRHITMPVSSRPTMLATRAKNSSF